MRPRDARTVYLNGKPPEEAAKIFAQADRLGPNPDDADWLVAYAAEEAAKKIDAAMAAFPAMLTRLDRVEQLVTDLAKAQAAQPPPKPDLMAGLRAAPNAQLDRIELRLQAQDARLGRIENPPGKPLVTHLGGVAITLAFLAFGYFGRSLSPAAVFGSFGLLAYLYLAPAFGPRLVTFAQRLRR